MKKLKIWFDNKLFRYKYTRKIRKENEVLDALLGVAVGDALGVPYEFYSREEMQKNPATEMVGFGTYYQIKGTWSDDSSLTFCLAESLIDGYNLKDIAIKFIHWKNEALWTPRGEVFDIGFTTSNAISRLQELIENENIEELNNQKKYGAVDENGNGSIMRILPLLFHIKDMSINKQFDIIWDVSALTHRHIRAAMSCLIYLKYAEKLLNKLDKHIAYNNTREEILAFWDDISFPISEREHFKRLIQNNILDIKEGELNTGGYVIDGLESSFWFLLKKRTYKQTVLSIINLGNDTDTMAAITGGLAGILYGKRNIPEDWIFSIACLKDIFKLGKKLSERNNKIL